MAMSLMWLIHGWCVGMVINVGLMCDKCVSHVWALRD